MNVNQKISVNLFEGVKGGFPLWHQMGLGKMNHTFEETHNKVVPVDPSDPLFKKWMKVPENPIARHPIEVISNITFKNPTAAW